MKKTIPKLTVFELHSYCIQNIFTILCVTGSGRYTLSFCMCILVLVNLSVASLGNGYWVCTMHIAYLLYYIETGKLVKKQCSNTGLPV